MCSFTTLLIIYEPLNFIIMKRKSFVLLFTLLFFSINFAISKPISKEQALLIAKNKLIYLSKTNFSVKTIEEKTINSETGYYIAHLQPMGFIVVSADTELFPIYSYSFTNNFYRTDKNEFNPLDNLLKQNISNFLENKDLKTTEINKRINAEWNYYLSEYFNPNKNKELIQWPPAGTTSTGGWLETNWSQGNPYNQFCPLDLDNGGRSLAGCPAVALAMVINYYETVNSTTFTDDDDYVHNYSGNNFTIDDDYVTYDFLNFPAINSFLSDITIKYNNQQTITDEQAAALTFACGVAATQVYSAGGSGTFGIDQAFEAYQKFNFASAELIDETNPDFYTIFSQNMIDGKPAHVASTDPPPVTMGHNYVADGYNTDNYYHLNMGWGGSYNNWYLIPDEIPYGLTELEGAILNICDPPINDETEVYYFQVDEQIGAATIGSNTIAIDVQYGTDLSALIPTFQLSRGANAEIDGSEVISGETVVDFSNCPVTFTVIAENGTDTKDWYISITVVANNETEFLSFELDEQTSPATIENGTIDIEVETGTDLSSLVPIFTLSEGASVEVDGNPVESGVTEIDFSEGTVDFDVTAQDETTTETWSVTVTLEQTSVNDLTDKFDLYPNPTNGIVNITSENIEEINIYNSAGVKIETYVKPENNILINLKNKGYTSGVYFFKFEDKTGKYLYKKLILQ